MHTKLNWFQECSPNVNKVKSNKLSRVNHELQWKGAWSRVSRNHCTQLLHDDKTQCVPAVVAQSQNNPVIWNENYNS